jgi:hypothetical protein
MATLLQLRTRVRQRSDQELGPSQTGVDDHYITNSELNAYINASIAELYDLILKSDGDQYLTSTTFTTTAGTQEYDLPANFYKLKGVEQQESADRWRTLRKFNFNERNKSGLAYRLRSGVIRFNEIPDTGVTMRLWYMPKATELSSDSDTFDGINQFEEYVVVDAAIKIMIKEESDPSALVMQKSSLYARIAEMADDRDSGEPDSISDYRRTSVFDSRGWEMDDE